eukprot:Awhi_evm1s4826
MSIMNKIAATVDYDVDNLFERLYLEFTGPEGAMITVKKYTLSSCANKDPTASLCDAFHPYASGSTDNLAVCCNEVNLCGPGEGTCSSDDECKAGLTCNGVCNFGAGDVACCQ